MIEAANAGLQNHRTLAHLKNAAGPERDSSLRAGGVGVGVCSVYRLTGTRSAGLTAAAGFTVCVRAADVLVL
jgi:hypothetical protein